MFLEGRDGKEGVAGMFLEVLFLLLTLLGFLAASLGEGVGGMICGDWMLSAAVSEEPSACLLSHQVIFPWTGAWYLLTALLNFLGIQDETGLQLTGVAALAST